MAYSLCLIRVIGMDLCGVKAGSAMRMSLQKQKYRFNHLKFLINFCENPLKGEALFARMFRGIQPFMRTKKILSDRPFFGVGGFIMEIGVEGSHEIVSRIFSGGHNSFVESRLALKGYF